MSNDVVTVGLTVIFAGFLSTVCYLAAVALASYYAFARVSFGILTP